MLATEASVTQAAHYRGMLSAWELGNYPSLQKHVMNFYKRPQMLRMEAVCSSETSEPTF